MSKVLKCDASASTGTGSYCEKALSAPDSWTTISLLVPTDSLASWAGGGANPHIIDLLTGVTIDDAAVYQASGNVWNTWWSGGSGGSLTGWALTTVELHHVTGGSSDLYINTVLVASGIDASASDFDTFRIGLMQISALSPSVLYIDNVMVGTSRGASDIFSDDFESGDLSAWDSTTGDVSVVDSPSPPIPTPTPIAFQSLDPHGKWRVKIKPELHQGWNEALTFYPSDINYSIRSGRDDPCSIGFKIALSDPVLERERAKAPHTNSFGPWRSDWRLYYGNHIILAGIITKAQIDEENQAIDVAGEDYLTYLKRRIWPVNYTDTSHWGDTDNGYSPFFVANDITSIKAIKNMIEAMNDRTTAAMNAKVASKRLYYVDGYGDFGAIIGFSIVPGDDTSFFDEIANIAAEDGNVGFDYFCNEGRRIQVYADRYDKPPSKYPTITRDMLAKLSWSNEGPLCTEMIGFGVGGGISSKKLYHDGTNRFGLMEETVHFNDSYITQEQVDSGTQAKAFLNSNPQHDSVITLYADQLGTAFYRERAGVILNIRTDVLMPFAGINEDWRATQLNFNVSNSGDNLVEITCEQAYIKKVQDD